MTTLTLILTSATPSPAQVAPADRLCDNAFEDCRATILEMIRNEKAGIDVWYWFMTDWRYSSEIIKRWQAGVPVRILLDLRSDAGYPAGVTIRQSFINAGIPIRHKVTTGINHWKMMLYRGQSAVHFSAANFANGSYSPSEAGGEYRRYVDEAIYFTTDQNVVQTFMNKYDDIWTNTTHYAQPGEHLRSADEKLSELFGNQLDPELNFPPDEDYQNRLIAADEERDAADRRRHVPHHVGQGSRRNDSSGPGGRSGSPHHRPAAVSEYDVLLALLQRRPDVHWRASPSNGKTTVPIRTCTRSRSCSTAWTWRSSARRTGRRHRRTLSASTTTSRARRGSSTGSRRSFCESGTTRESTAPPSLRRNTSTTRRAGRKHPSTSRRQTVRSASRHRSRSKWEGGWWAHKYDIYFGTTNPPPLVAQNFMPGSATAGVSSNKESFNPCAPPAPFVSVCPAGLAPGTTYYWRIRGKTMIGDGGGPLNAPARSIAGPIWSFTTAGSAPAPPSEASRIVADAYVRGGQYANTNYGSATELIVKYSTDAAYLRESYMRLDISAVKTGQTVRLRLFGKLSDTRVSSVTATIVPVATNGWTETAVTWNNRPAVGSGTWPTVTVSGTTAKWDQINITSQVQALRAAGTNSVAIAIKGAADTLPYVTFSARETANAPQLVITP